MGMGRETEPANTTLPGPGDSPGFPSPGPGAGRAAIVGEVAKLLTTDCKTLGCVAAADCTAVPLCRFCSEGAEERRSFGCLDADIGCLGDKPLGDSDGNVVTSTDGAGVVIILGAGARLTTGPGDCRAREADVSGAGLGTPGPELR